MTNASSLDLGSLEWVKPEIEKSLQEASKALAQAQDSKDGLAQIQFGQTHLHQAQGALTIVGFDGLGMLGAQLDTYLGALSRGDLPFTEQARKLCLRAFAVMGNYLYNVSQGQPDQPIRLLPMLQELARANNQPVPTAGDLFYPDLSAPLPQREKPVPILTGATLSKHLRKARTQFDEGLLAWLKSPGDPVAAQQMRIASQDLTEIQTPANVRALWWCAQAFFDGLITGAKPTTDIQRLCAQLGSQMRHTSYGTMNAQDKLLRAVLFQVAQMPPETPTQIAVRKTWQLDDLVIGQTLPVLDEPIAPIITLARATLEKAEHDWTRVASGQLEAINDFENHLKGVEEAAAKIGRPSLVSFVHALRALVKPTDTSGTSSAELLDFHVLTSTEASPLADALRMEMATALLLVGTVLQRPVEEKDFEAQTHTVLERFHALQKGLPLATPSIVPGADVARKVQEQEATRQLLGEIKSNLVSVEHILDDFFRGNATTEALSKVDQPLAQIINTFTVMGDADASEFSTQIRQTIQAFTQKNQPPSESDSQDLARKISGLGFYLEALGQGPANLQTILNPEATIVDTRSLQNEAEITSKFFNDIQASLHEPPPAPAEAVVHVAPSPVSLPETLAVDTLATPASPVIEPPVPVPPPPPTTKPVIDEELLAIFLEEAEEVLETVRVHLDILRTAPDSHDDFVTVRRGFHTLKGSGRMVGLSDFGETAWGIEQTLNRWMQLDQIPTPALLDLISNTREVLVNWVKRLTTGNLASFDTSALMQQAEHLRHATPASLDEADSQPSTTGTTASLEEAVAPTTPLPETKVETLLETLPKDLLDLETPHENLVDSANRSIESEQVPVSVAAVDAPLTQPDELLPEESVRLESPPKVVETIFEPPPTPQPLVMDVEPQDAPESSRGDTVQEATVRIGFSEISTGLFALFTAEARQHLNVLGHELPLLISDPTSLPEPRLIRAAHTLAGISGTAGIPAMLGLARALENALMRIAEAGRSVTAFDGELLIVVQRQLEDMFEQVSTANRQPESMPELEAQLDHLPSPSITETASTPQAELPSEPDSEDPQEDEDNTPAVFDDIDPQLLPIVLEESTELLSQLRASLRSWREKPYDNEPPQLIARLLHTLKGGARMAGAMTLGEQLHGLETRLGAPEQLDEAARVHLIETLESELDHLEEAYASLASPAPETTTPSAPPADTAVPLTTTPALITPQKAESLEEPASTNLLGGNLRIKAETIDQWVSEAGEIGISRTRIEGELRVLRRSLLDLTENVIRLRNQLREIEIQAEVQMHARVSHAGQTHEAFDPLEMDRFTRLQELTRMMAESVNDVTTVQQNLLRSLDGADVALNAQARMTRDLQQVLMRARMLPFDRLADRLHRIVRQSAKELGKRVNLDVVGGRVEVDRSLLDGIISPLEHMLRNALAHGIEAPEVRQAQGKQALGQITIELSQEGNEILLELSDDGAGLNYDRIRQKGIDLGFIGADEVVDHRRLANLIFLPGFSTATNVSTLSGRGVGMDVVRTDVSGLGGRIELSSEPGKGTRFSIHLPLTLISTQALLVQAGTKNYAIPASMVAQVLEVRTEALDAIRERGDVEWQGKHYAYRYLPRLLGDTETQPEQGRFSWIMLLHAGTQTIALHVDQLRSTQEIIVKRAGPQLARMVGISGATLMGEGEIVLIINPIALSSRGAENALLIAPPKVSTVESKQDVVMIVDDSLTVRKITGRMFEREGFKVITAKDGADALEQLREAKPDIILSDIEMPRMDGFDLLRNIRADQRIGNIPVIMITSRLADKHRNYASELGADHYLGKPYQEDELLELARHYIAQSRKEHQ